MNDDLNSIHTPAFVVNEAVALRNIKAFQAHCDKAGLALRPHIKTHKSIRFAKAQIAAGAIGITCQKISEAEAMIAEGIDNVLITFNIIGKAKLKRLVALSRNLSALSVVADNSVVVRGLSGAFAAAPRAGRWARRQRRPAQHVWADALAGGEGDLARRQAPAHPPGRALDPSPPSPGEHAGAPH